MGRLRALTLGVPLDRDHESAVRALRGHLDVPEGCASPCPHVSLLVLLDVPDPPGVDAALGTVAAANPALTVRARGIGVFHDGDGSLVLYVPVVRTPALARLHLDLYESVTATGATVDGHYTPASWFPHVTLWDRGLTPRALGDAVTTLARRPPVGWTLPVTDLARFEAGGVAAAVPLRAGRRPPA